MDRTLHGWSEMFDQIHMKEKKGVYDTDICADFQRIERAGLPTYHRILVPPQKFVKNFDTYKSSFLFPQYYAQVYPQISGLKKYSVMGVTDLAEVISFLYENIADNFSQYILLISEFEKNVYGGSVMSDGSRVMVDLTEGLQNQIAYGSKASFSCVAEESGKISFSGEYTEFVKEMFMEILDSIVILGSPEKQRFLKGYFELAFTQKLMEEDLRLVFFDYKADPRFYL